MDILTNTAPGYRVYEYLLALAPHEELGQRISVIRQAFAEKYNFRVVKTHCYNR